MAKDKYQPTPTELEILQVLWKEGASTVRFINDELNKTKKVGYTSTLKIMQLMAEKGILEREPQGKSHLYSPTIKEEDTQNTLLDKFLNSTFKGSASKLIMAALGNYNPDASELEEIKDFISKMENK